MLKLVICGVDDDLGSHRSVHHLSITRFLEALQFLDVLVGFLEVDSIGKELLLIETVNEAEEDTTNKCGDDANADGGKSCCDLQSSLLVGSVYQTAVRWEVGSSDGVGICSSAIVESSSHDSAEDSTDESWKSVQVVNSAGII